jgi:DNA-binding CsgD family transcriptional regulator
MTSAFWTLLSAPTPAGRTRSSLHSPPRMQAPRSRDRATWPAGQLLDQAIAIYQRLDAARDLARAEAALRQMGIRRGRHVTHRRAQGGWPSLTPSEQAVVDLVAEGLSNPQIGQRLYVSRRTVQTHLAHVFAKLHITSRTQLAAEAIRHRG